MYQYQYGIGVLALTFVVLVGIGIGIQAHILLMFLFSQDHSTILNTHKSLSFSPSIFLGSLYEKSILGPKIVNITPHFLS